MATLVAQEHGARHGEPQLQPLHPGSPPPVPGHGPRRRPPPQRRPVLNARFLPRGAIRTRAVAVCDDDVALPARALSFALALFRSRSRSGPAPPLVGFFGRAHDLDPRAASGRRRSSRSALACPPAAAACIGPAADQARAAAACPAPGAAPPSAPPLPGPTPRAASSARGPGLDVGAELQQQLDEVRSALRDGRVQQADAGRVDGVGRAPLRVAPLQPPPPPTNSAASSSSAPPTATTTAAADEAAEEACIVVVERTTTWTSQGLRRMASAKIKKTV
uniref:Glycosyl transferase 64 domain-containing protein n=1 Tax=Ananas comosus var. bracteatus TaxID=296719 RepID=A0A6V7QWN5_ANACO